MDRIKHPLKRYGVIAPNNNPKNNFGVINEGISLK
jgi:hypothetical protein